MSHISHHGIPGQKWGVRRYQNKDGTLTDAGRKRINEFRSKTQTANDHYQRAIKRVEKTKAATSKIDKRQNAGLATYQYEKGLKDSKEAKRIQKSLARKGINVKPSENQQKLRTEAGELFVKKCFARRAAECTASDISVGIQFAIQTAILGEPTTAIKRDYSAYKIK